MYKIALVNMKGGVGKTTLAVNLADALARREDKRVLLVDLDPQFNATQCLLSGDEYVARRAAGGDTIVSIFVESEHQVVSAVTGAKTATAKKLEDIEAWYIKPNLDLIPGDLELHRLDMGGGQGRELRLKRYLQKVKDRYDYVIIDTPPTPSHWMTSALLASDWYLVPVKPEPLSRVGIDLLRGVVDRISENHGHDIECLGVVITLADRRTRVFSEAKEFLDKNKVWKAKRFKADMPHRTQIAREVGNQNLILDTQETDSMRALVAIVAEVEERLGDG